MLLITVLAFLRLCIWVQLCRVSICTQEKTGGITGPILGIANVVKHKYDV